MWHVQTASDTGMRRARNKMQHLTTLLRDTNGLAAAACVRK